MKVLIAAPITGIKQYSINRWFDWIANQKYEFESVDFALCVNGTKYKESEKLYDMLNQVEILKGTSVKKPIVLWNQDKKDTTMLQRITYARETLRRFAVKEDYDYLFFLDTDTIPINLNAIDLLIKRNCQIVSGLYFYKGTKVPVMTDYKTGTNFTLDVIEEAANNNQLLECGIFGLGCCMISRSIFAIYEFNFEKFGEEIGDDYGYCFQLDQVGIARILDVNVPCYHLGESQKDPISEGIKEQDEKIK